MLLTEGGKYVYRVISLHVIKYYDWNPMQSVSFSAA